MNVNVTQDFKTYFQSTAASGAFALPASFLVQCDSSIVSAVDVSVTNRAGVTPVQRIQF